jgi:hypothetical protein
MSSANSPYEITEACFSSLKWPPERWMAQRLLRTSPPTPSSLVAEAIKRCAPAHSRR